MADGGDDSSNDSRYKAPAQKALSDILNQDKEDESLERYKKALLKPDCTGLEVFPADPRKVIVSKCSLLIDGRPDIVMDLTSDLAQLKKKDFVLKEGITYKIRVHFYVQRDIVSGLVFQQKSYRKGIQVDKSRYMVGSYAPDKEAHTFTTPEEDIPSGLMYRGHYTNKAIFTDDDKNEYLKWEWVMHIKKDWEK